MLLLISDKCLKKSVKLTTTMRETQKSRTHRTKATGGSSETTEARHGDLGKYGHKKWSRTRGRVDGCDDDPV